MKLVYKKDRRFMIKKHSSKAFAGVGGGANKIDLYDVIFEGKMIARVFEKEVAYQVIYNRALKGFVRDEDFEEVE